MDELLLRNLLEKYLTGELSEPERVSLAQLLEQPGYQQLLGQLLSTEFINHRFDEGGHDAIIEKIGAHVLAAISPAKNSRLVYMKRWAAIAAVIFVLVAAGFYLTTKKAVLPGKPELATGSEQIAPGGNKAILTLKDGKKVNLSGVSNGEVAEQGNTKIVKADSGLLIYSASNGSDREIAMNTLTTPRGGIFQLSLSDGTKVWLNAASSITYPAVFNSNQRKVSITGEAYFEVAKDKTRPFEVTVNNMRIEVLGTHFNVNAYDNEGEKKTTLLEGSIRLTNGSYQTLLKPGDQAQLDKNDKITILQPGDLEQAIAWKTGFFNFTNADLSTIMRQLERWYDIDVRFDGPVPQRHFQGELPRSLMLDEILKVLKEENIKYKIEGKMLIIES